MSVTLINFIISFKTISTLFYSVLFLLSAGFLIVGLVQAFSFKRKFLANKLFNYSAISATIMLIVWFIVAFISQTLNIGVAGDIPTPGIPQSVRTYGVDNYNSISYSNSTAGYISDTREFNKTTYSASIKTREVEDITKKAIALIHAAGGRVDSSNSNNNYGSINFVVPKSNFESFQTDISSLVNPKLYTKYINQENLLNQKQNIEASQKSNEQNISETELSITKLNEDYKKNSAKSSSTLSKAKSQLAYVNSELSRATDTAEIASLSAQKNNATSYLQSVYTAIGNQDYSHEHDLAVYNYNLKTQNTQKDNLTKDNQKFTENVETVNGSISISYVSLWQLFDIYSPISLATIIGILILVSVVYGVCKLIKYIKSKPVVSVDPNEVSLHYYSLWYVLTILGLVLIMFLYSLFTTSYYYGGLGGGDIPTPGVPTSVRTY